MADVDDVIEIGGSASFVIVVRSIRLVVPKSAENILYAGGIYGFVDPK